MPARPGSPMSAPRSGMPRSPTSPRTARIARSTLGLTRATLVSDAGRHRLEVRVSDAEDLDLAVNLEAVRVPDGRIRRHAAQRQREGPHAAGRIAAAPRRRDRQRLRQRSPRFHGRRSRGRAVARRRSAPHPGLARFLPGEPAAARPAVDDSTEGDVAHPGCQGQGGRRVAGDQGRAALAGPGPEWRTPPDRRSPAGRGRAGGPRVRLARSPVQVRGRAHRRHGRRRHPRGAHPARRHRECGARVGGRDDPASRGRGTIRRGIRSHERHTPVARQEGADQRLRPDRRRLRHGAYARGAQ